MPAFITIPIPTPTTKPTTVPTTGTGINDPTVAPAPPSFAMTTPANAVPAYFVP